MKLLMMVEEGKVTTVIVSLPVGRPFDMVVDGKVMAVNVVLPGVVTTGMVVDGGETSDVDCVGLLSDAPLPLVGVVPFVPPVVPNAVPEGLDPSEPEEKAGVGEEVKGVVFCVGNPSSVADPGVAGVDVVVGADESVLVAITPVDPLVVTVVPAATAVEVVFV